MLGLKPLGQQRHARRNAPRWRMKQHRHGNAPHQHQRHDLEQRIEPDRIDHAFAAARHLIAARAEQYGKRRQHHRRHRHRGRHQRPFGDNRQRRANRAQLQRHIGHRARQRDHRYEAGNHDIMAKAGGEKIGNGGGLLLSHSARQGGEKARRANQQQDGREVDRQIIPPIAHRTADRAIDRPARTIDAQRQRISDMAQPPATPCRIGAYFGKGGNAKQHRHQRQHEKCSACEAHRLALIAASYLKRPSAAVSPTPT